MSLQLKLRVVFPASNSACGLGPTTSCPDVWALMADIPDLVEADYALPTQTNVQEKLAKWAEAEEEDDCAKFKELALPLVGMRLKLKTGAKPAVLDPRPQRVRALAGRREPDILLVASKLQESRARVTPMPKVETGSLAELKKQREEAYLRLKAQREVEGKSLDSLFGDRAVRHIQHAMEKRKTVEGAGTRVREALSNAKLERKDNKPKEAKAAAFSAESQPMGRTARSQNTPSRLAIST